MKKIILILASALTFIGCHSKDLHSFYSESLLTDIPNNKNYIYYVVIPHAGCPGCVTDAEELLILNKNSNRLFFIITNYSSKKSLRLKLGEDVMKYKNVFLDSTNKYYANFFKDNIYPISIHLDKNKINDILVGIPNI
ncbi:hypothetical protein UMM65_15815 [Aureibaculum sp. 2210JD6-5]|uniref:hypothetical protein n=1 Tax=Aureibaculum sp. 2210JD6-5 TaxID=3103957 RepID=UPI002AAE6604|nr:hypothetical protein [Aureibaculum sp. 2210JD6-5]MDY7396715.1 hypothetical protein [Aureibaculum sp. 2210JD6-5]